MQHSLENLDLFLGASIHNYEFLILKNIILFNQRKRISYYKN